MNPQKLALLTKHGKKFAAKPQRSAGEQVLNGVYYATDGAAYVTDRHKLLRLRNVHSNKDAETRSLTSGGKIDGVYPDVSKIFPKDLTAHLTVSESDIPRLISVTKAVLSVAKTVDERFPIVTILDGVLTYNNDKAPVQIRTSVTKSTEEHQTIALNPAFVADALAVFKDVGSAEVSVHISSSMAPIVFYDDKNGVDVLVSPYRTGGQ